jgi:hypothetical protein
VNARLDAVEEFSISTAGQGSEQSGQGAVQIRFETKRGGNVYHGGAWWYHRNDFFNSNYWFNNLTGVPRQRQRLNQWGGNVGGPIWKEKLFFFVSEDNYKNPGSISRPRTILSTNSLAGLFDYVPCTPPGTATNPCGFVFAANPNAYTTCVSASSRNPSGGQLCTADLLAYAASVGLPNAPDAISMSMLNAVQTVRTAPGVGTDKVGSPWVDTVRFNNSFAGVRRFPDVRLDFSITKNIQWTGIYHYNYFSSLPDTLNGLDPTFPVAPFNTLKGGQYSNRNEWVSAVRWNIGATKSNEVRAGLTSSPVSFFPDLPLSGYPTADTNLGAIPIRRSYTATITVPTPGFGTQGRNGGIFQLLDTFSWSKGKHNIMFGGDWTRVRFIQYLASRAVNTATLGLNTSDPANAAITNAFPASMGASSTDQGNARNLYAYLLGRVTSYTGTISVNEGTRQYEPLKPQKTRIIQHEYGFYANDSWRILPQLTLNVGMRWELQLAPVDPKNISFRVQGSETGVWGISGLDNLFEPGTLTGAIPTYELNGNRKWYENDMNNFAPNIGLAWTPGFSNKFVKSVFGEAGKSVFRAAYSVNYTREGTNNFSSIAFANPGIDGSIFANAVAPGGACPAPPYNTIGSFPAGCLTFTGLFNGDLQSLTTTPSAFPSAPFQITTNSGQSVNSFKSGLGTPVVHNWSFGIQREISPSIVVEVRYVGNHGAGLWRQDNINERNIFENGFLTEFTNAQKNLSICRTTANLPTCRTNSGFTGAAANFSGNFSNLGLSDATLGAQVPVPILTQLFTGAGGQQSGSNTSAAANFRSGTFVTWLLNGAAGSLANNMTFNTTFLCNLVGSAALPGAPCSASAPVSTIYPVNFWVANPHASGGAFRFNNNTHTTYNGMTLEVRKRYSKGLQFSGNYTFSKSLTNYYGNSSVSASNFTTLRDPGFDKGPSPWDVRHAFKINLMYSFPFGPGRKWNSSHAWINRLIEHWEVSAINRWQSGGVFQLTSGGDFLTFNQNDPGVILKGITPKQIQSSLSIRKLPTGQVFYFPAALIGSNGQANTSFIAPCNTAGKLCQKVSLYGPQFFRADINVAKKFKIFERYEFEYRAEFLNAFNNINFLATGQGGGSTSITGTTFGRVTSAFQDPNSTDDFGGRIIQMVIRVRF